MASVTSGGLSEDDGFVLFLSDMVADIFYFLDIYSYGKLPPHCEQRFLPCEIGCVRYSLQDGIMADFHHFIDPGEFQESQRDTGVRGSLSGVTAAQNLFLKRISVRTACISKEGRVNPGGPAHVCSDDRFRINWCLGRMASITGRKWLFAVEDLITKLYQKKYQKEPSTVWVYRKLNVCLWDFSTNTRCKWHEENDIICCALASCKKMGYCISKSFASAYGVPLTAAHLPLQNSDCDQSTNTRIVKRDAAHTQVRFFHSGCDKPLGSPRQDQEFVPSNCEFETFTFFKQKEIF
uniref:Maelstrom spermatogenic transposon silencer n=1 Tax=Zosterops lateralis melanops TaxID=1220523 RepID=A0A8D2NUR6_ZOSLA